MQVDTSGNLILQIAYDEKRRGGTRACASIVNLALSEGRTYKAVYQVIEEVIGCEIKIYDVSDVATGAEEDAANPYAHLSLVEFTKPEFTCKKVGKQGFKDGTPVYSYKNRLD